MQVCAFVYLRFLSVFSQQSVLNGTTVQFVTLMKVPNLGLRTRAYY